MEPNMEIILGIVLGCLAWLLVGWLGYGMLNQCRYDQWSTPAIKKEVDLWVFKVSLAFGILTCLLAGVILLIQAIDNMADPRG